MRSEDIFANGLLRNPLAKNRALRGSAIASFFARTQRTLRAPPIQVAWASSKPKDCDQPGLHGHKRRADYRRAAKSLFLPEKRPQITFFYFFSFFFQFIQANPLFFQFIKGIKARAFRAFPT
jgi:uncharacterized protein with von Willebrand factor type A (vWA) domain